MPCFCQIKTGFNVSEMDKVIPEAIMKISRRMSTISEENVFGV